MDVTTGVIYCGGVSQDDSVAQADQQSPFGWVNNRGLALQAVSRQGCTCHRRDMQGVGKEWCDTRYPWDVCQPQHLINYHRHFFFANIRSNVVTLPSTMTPPNNARYPITSVGVTY